MAETHYQPPIDFEEKNKGKLSVGTYAVKKISDVVISFGSLILGAVLGNYIGNKFNLPRSESNQEFDAMLSAPGARDKFPFSMLPSRVHFISTAIGAFIGLLTGGIIQGYSRWRKHESERLAVSEINADVANMKIRYRTDPELLRENDRLRAMLAEEEQKTAALQKQNPTPAEKIAAAGPRDPLARESSLLGAPAL